MIIIHQEKAKAKTKRIEKTKRDEITGSSIKMPKLNFKSSRRDYQDDYKVIISFNK